MEEEQIKLLDEVMERLNKIRSTLKKESENKSESKSKKAKMRVHVMTKDETEAEQKVDNAKKRVIRGPQASSSAPEKKKSVETAPLESKSVTIKKGRFWVTDIPKSKGGKTRRRRHNHKRK